MDIKTSFQNHQLRWAVGIGIGILIIFVGILLFAITNPFSSSDTSSATTGSSSSSGSNTSSSTTPTNTQTQPVAQSESTIEAQQSIHGSASSVSAEDRTLTVTPHNLPEDAKYQNVTVSLPEESTITLIQRKSQRQISEESSEENAEPTSKVSTQSLSVSDVREDDEVIVSLERKIEKGTQPLTATRVQVLSRLE